MSEETEVSHIIITNNFTEINTHVLSNAVNAKVTFNERIQGVTKVCR